MYFRAQQTHSEALVQERFGAKGQSTRELTTALLITNQRTFAPVSRINYLSFGGV